MMAPINDAIKKQRNKKANKNKTENEKQVKKMQLKQELVGTATTTENEEYPNLKKPSIRKVLDQEKEKGATTEEDISQLVTMASKGNGRKL